MGGGSILDIHDFIKYTFYKMELLFTKRCLIEQTLSSIFNQTVPHLLQEAWNGLTLSINVK